MISRIICRNDEVNKTVVEDKIIIKNKATLNINNNDFFKDML